MLKASTHRAPNEPASIALASIVPVPSSSSVTVIFWQTAIGVLSPSITVTTASQLDWLPFWSVTVKVTVFGPKLEQSKVFMSIEVLLKVQLSKLPPSIFAGVMVAV